MTYDQGVDHDASFKLNLVLYNFPYAGNVNGGSLYNVGSGGRYWSRTAYSTKNAYHLYFYSTNVSPAGYGSCYNGYSIRCVATT